ncbi:23S rRNA (uracil(1939)-C(5))-methyltransferase RlmD [Candidatus Odyssella thessalonicensis]|uniref:23S rRNA (uracil(1939)-C(5))-methyltransferase RlmD n=1 Tax=Candidatus Odyssella thessalonicensis TaxID=84647 RepID=UPI000225BB25|nr:23S rRNA (uracil(1939)-C(5))-methyltransferase RlmD [Candidatus Odyssella thessalonicensis]
MRAKIESIGIDGDGVAIVEGEKYFVPFTAPGDEIDFEVIKGKKYSRINVNQFFQKSPLRQSPPCVHFEECGGCKLQHLNQPSYQEFKVGLLKRALEFHGVKAQEWKPLHIIPPHRRRRISLTFAHRHEGMMIGYMRRGTKWIIDNKECHLVLPEIEQLIPRLRRLLATMFQSRESGTVDILATKVGLDVNLKTGFLRNPTLPQIEDLTSFAQENNIARLLINYRPLVTFKEPVVNFSGVDVAVEAGKFLQASDDADEFMLQRVAEYMPIKVNRGVDLFSGRGTFTFLMAKRGPTDAFECENDAITALQSAANKAQIPITVIKRDLFANPLSAEELQEYDFIFVDPPRAGALAQVEQVAQSTLQHVVYISCNPASFARDAQVLCQAGFSLESVTPLDQFLWSEHLEVIGKFYRP